MRSSTTRVEDGDVCIGNVGCVECKVMSWLRRSAIMDCCCESDSAELVYGRLASRLPCWSAWCR